MWNFRCVAGAGPRRGYLGYSGHLVSRFVYPYTSGNRWFLQETGVGVASLGCHAHSIWRPHLQLGESTKWRRKKHEETEGFLTDELLIVVAIILIIAAIAIPNLLRARMAANESSAVGSIRTINTGMVTYNTGYPTIGFASALANLGGAAGGACTPATNTACLIDSVLSAGTKSGYIFTAQPGVVAVPQTT